jgi:hypothetical protein
VTVEAGNGILGCVKRGIVLIAEDDESIGFLSGRFSAYRQSDGSTLRKALRQSVRRRRSPGVGRERTLCLSASASICRADRVVSGRREAWAIRMGHER